MERKNNIPDFVHNGPYGVGFADRNHGWVIMHSHEISAYYIAKQMFAAGIKCGPWRVDI